MQGRERWYFAAVSLNNSAILLVERRQYRRAAAVLHDSMLAILEATFDPSSTSIVDRERTSSYMHASVGRRQQGALAMETLEGMLNRASRYLMDSSPASLDSKRTPRVEIVVHVLDVDVTRLVMKGGMFPVDTLTLLRIDDSRSQDLVDDYQAGSHLAMLTTLSNFAVTTLLLPHAEQGLRARALNVINHAFHIAYSLLLESFAGNGGPFVSLAALQLSVMMAQCHYQLHVELGDCHEAWNSLNHYRFVRRALEEESRHPSPLGGLSVTHAKAA